MKMKHQEVNIYQEYKMAKLDKHTKIMKDYPKYKKEHLKYIKKKVLEFDMKLNILMNKNYNININKIQLTKNDRVFIIMGASHTAFINDFMKRSPKYELMDVSIYLK